MKTLIALTLLFGMNAAAFAGAGCGGKADKTAETCSKEKEKDESACSKDKDAEACSDKKAEKKG